MTSRTARSQRTATAPMLTVLSVLPAGEWTTTARLAALARDAGLPVTVEDGELMVGRSTFQSVARGLRRRGWAVYRADGQWCRTAGGTAAHEDNHERETA